MLTVLQKNIKLTNKLTDIKKIIYDFKILIKHYVPKTIISSVKIVFKIKFYQYFKIIYCFNLLFFVGKLLK